MTPVVHTPEQAAERLGGISVRTLVGLLRAGGYAYTELSPGAHPWGRGRRTWGLTEQQLSEIVSGQARTIPAPVLQQKSARRSPSLPGHDGKTRLRIGG